jgi:outer membrane protein TolC
VESLQQQASNEIRTLITQLYNQLCALRSQCHALAEGITSAEAYLHSTRIAFKEGVTTTADLLDAETKVAQIRIERVEVAYNFDITLAKLLEAVGESEQLPQLIHSSASHSITYDTPPYETH